MRHAAALVVTAIVAVAHSPVSADPSIVDHELGYVNRPAFYLREERVEVGLAVVSGSAHEDTEARVQVRVGGIGLAGGRSLGNLYAAKLRVEVGALLTDTEGRFVSGILDARPLGFSLVGVVRVDLLPLRLARERRFNSEESYRVHLLGVGAQLPLVGDIGSERFGLLLRVAANAVGARREHYVRGSPYTGFQLGDVTAALSVLLGESIWGNRGGFGAGVSGGGGFGAAVGDSTPMGTDWHTDGFLFGDVHLSFGSHLALFCRGQVRWTGDTGNENVAQRSEVVGGVRVGL
jgi:hypothetical protein